MTPEQGWLVDVLNMGKLPWGCEGQPASCPTERLFDSYVMHAQRQGVRRRSIETMLGMFLKKMVPNLWKREGTYRKDYRTDCQGMIYDFPPLAECRAQIEKLLQQRIEWDGPSEWIAPEVTPGDYGEGM
jgi:hypothetical protein